ncbi:MAG: kinase [Gammaproteobacteria bacterium]|nr:kinase [Gammaproteobacteria bacterium]
MKSQLIQSFIDKHKLDNGFSLLALKWFKPIAELIAGHQKREGRPFFVGLNGSQGSGKSTLTDFIKHYLTDKYELNVAVVSLDDFYLSQETRQHLANTIHPLFKTRGVPGTHDTVLMQQVLTDLQQQKIGIALPRFNKAIDNPFPQSEWPLVNEKVDLVILEGWCWGTLPQLPEQLTEAVNDLEKNEDNAAVWRTYVNAQLAESYVPLYQFMDFWLMLKAPSFDCVSAWRTQQEHKLLAASAGGDTSGVMTDQQVQRFIQHYQRLTEQSLVTLPNSADVVVSLDENRKITGISGQQQAQLQQLVEGEV